MLPERIQFSKLNAGGNDFICLDNTAGAFGRVLSSPFLAEFVRRLCRRGVSVGADGVIMACGLGSQGGVDVVARFLEPDGSEAELCGNGTACFTYWLVTKGLVAGPEVRILTAAGMATGRLDGADRQQVVVCVPDPRDPEMDVTIDVAGEEWQVDCLHTGVPHAVAFVDRLEDLDVDYWGPGIRRHPRFQPRGVNANFVQVLDVGRIAIRTFEFGVEDETLACGTGSAAAAIISCLRFGWPEPYRTGKEAVQVTVRGGETLQVWFVCNEGNRISDVCLETRVRAVYEAELRAEFMSELRGSAGQAEVSSHALT